jgi:hypothetical protein
MKGKVKELFEEWYVDNNAIRIYETPFYLSGLSMQWGLYQDFADSLGYQLIVDLNIGVGYNCEIFATNDETEAPFQNFEIHTTRNEARQAAILKLEELINK